MKVIYFFALNLTFHILVMKLSQTHHTTFLRGLYWRLFQGKYWPHNSFHILASRGRCTSKYVYHTKLSQPETSGEHRSTCWPPDGWEESYGKHASIHVHECEWRDRNTHAAGESINEELHTVPSCKQETCLIEVCVSQDMTEWIFTESTMESGKILQRSSAGWVESVQQGALIACVGKIKGQGLYFPGKLIQLPSPCDGQLYNNSLTPFFKKSHPLNLWIINIYCTGLLKIWICCDLQNYSGNWHKCTHSFLTHTDTSLLVEPSLCLNEWIRAAWGIQWMHG